MLVLIELIGELMLHISASQLATKYGHKRNP